MNSQFKKMLRDSGFTFTGDDNTWTAEDNEKVSRWAQLTGFDLSKLSQQSEDNENPTEQQVVVPDDESPTENPTDFDNLAEQQVVVPVNENPTEQQVVVPDDENHTDANHTDPENEME